MNGLEAACLALFDTSIGSRLEPGWAAGVIQQRTRTIKAGSMVYVECFPVWNTNTAARVRSEAAKEAHREAQRRMDEKNAKKKLIRKMNANFGRGDLFITCEHAPEKQAQDAKAAQRIMQNFLRRVKTIRRRRGLPDMRYIYVIEQTNSRVYGTRFHYHVIMSGDGVDRDEIEQAWTRGKGGFCNSRRTLPDEKGLARLACYMLADKERRTPETDGKNPQKKAGRRWNCSKNLIEPVESVADKKISIRKAGQIAVSVLEEAGKIFGKLYPDCELIECEVKRSQWAAGVYISAELHRVTADRKERAIKKDHWKKRNQRSRTCRKHVANNGRIIS